MAGASRWLRSAFFCDGVPLLATIAVFLPIVCGTGLLVLNASDHPEMDAVREYLSHPAIAHEYEELQWYEPVQYGNHTLIRLRYRVETRPGYSTLRDQVFEITGGIACVYHPAADEWTSDLQWQPIGEPPL